MLMMTMTMMTLNITIMNSDDYYNDDDVDYNKDDYVVGDEVQDNVNGYYNIWIYLENMMMTASSLLAENSSA